MSLEASVSTKLKAPVAPAKAKKEQKASVTVDTSAAPTTALCVARPTCVERPRVLERSRVVRVHQRPFLPQLRRNLGARYFLYNEIDFGAYLQDMKAKLEADPNADFSLDMIDFGFKTMDFALKYTQFQMDIEQLVSDEEKRPSFFIAYTKGLSPGDIKFDPDGKIHLSDDIKTCGEIGGCGPKADSRLDHRIYNNLKDFPDDGHKFVLFKISCPAPRDPGHCVQAFLNPSGMRVRIVEFLNSDLFRQFFIASNTAHVYKNTIKFLTHHLPSDLHDLTEDVTAHLSHLLAHRIGERKLLMLVTEKSYGKGLYNDQFDASDQISYAHVPAEADPSDDLLLHCGSVQIMIDKVKHNGLKPGDSQWFKKAVVHTCQKLECELAFLGCTELEIILDDDIRAELEQDQPLEFVNSEEVIGQVLSNALDPRYEINIRGLSDARRAAAAAVAKVPFVLTTIAELRRRRQEQVIQLQQLVERRLGLDLSRDADVQLADESQMLTVVTADSMDPVRAFSRPGSLANVLSPITVRRTDSRRHKKTLSLDEIPGGAFLDMGNGSDESFSSHGSHSAPTTPRASALSRSAIAPSRARSEVVPSLGATTTKDRADVEEVPLLHIATAATIHRRHAFVKGQENDTDDAADAK